MDTFQQLDNYFKSAKTWSDDHYCRVKQSRHRYQVAFLVAMGFNLLTLIAVSMLAHYQTVVPMLVHHYDNGVTTVEPVTQQNAPLNRAQVESDIARYIQHRESYDASSYRAQFELIHVLSNNTVEKEYLAEQDKSNPTAPIQVLGHHTKREVHIYSINFLDTMLQNKKDIHHDHHNLAEVVFSLTDTDKISGKSTQAHYNAMIAWHYVNPPDSPETRWQNWDGFEVTRYTKAARSMEAGA